MEKKFESLIGISKKATEEHPDETAVIVDDRRRTYGEAFEHAAKMVGHLSRYNIRKGGPVVIISINHADYVETVLGRIMTGAVVVKLNWRLAAPELRYLLFFNHVKHMFFRSGDAKTRGEMKELTSSLCPTMDMNLMDKTLEQWESPEELARRDDDHILMHLHTSGTTSFPKVVRYTDGELLRQIESCIDSLLFESSTIFQVMNQMFHSTSMGTYACLACGGTVVRLSRFDPVRYMVSVEVDWVTRLSVIPTVLTALLNHPDLGRYDMSNICVISYSICPMPPELIRRATDRFHYDSQQSYGITEMCSIAAILSSEDHLHCNMRYLSSVGKLIARHKVKIVHENGGECSAGEVGEICVKGPGVMKDYYQMEEETMTSIRYGWHHIRDMGGLDKEEYLYVRGRKNDMTISGGENISLLEIENVLNTHPDIAEASVMGVRDGYWGEAVHACMILKYQGTLNGQDIRDYCYGKITGYKIPKKVYIYEEPPRTATGKVMKAGPAEWIEEEIGG